MRNNRDEYKFHQARIMSAVHAVPVRGHTIAHAAAMSKRAVRADVKGAGLWVLVCLMLSVAGTVLAVSP